MEASVPHTNAGLVRQPRPESDRRHLCRDFGRSRDRRGLNVMTPRGDDVNRAIHRIRYDVLKPTPFRRLAFYQLGADNYNDHQFTTLAQGNASGLVEEWKPPRGGRRYSRTGIVCAGEVPWFSLHGGLIATRKEGSGRIAAWSSGMRARLGGRPINVPTAAVFGTRTAPERQRRTDAARSASPRCCRAISSRPSARTRDRADLGQGLLRAERRLEESARAGGNTGKMLHTRPPATRSRWKASAAA